MVATYNHTGNYTDAEWDALPHGNCGTQLNVAIWSMLGVSTAFLCLRLYCKFKRRNGIWWDDFILIAAWICLTVETSLLTTAVSLGYGSHSWDFPAGHKVRVIEFIDIIGTFSVTAAIWSKTSFALTMLRLTDGWVKTVIWCIIASMNVAMGMSALLLWVQCSPIEKTWDKSVDGTCWPRTVLVDIDIFSAAYSGAMDFALALLPWKIIWNLRMKKSERIGVAVAMSMGICAGITAIVKTAKLPRMISKDLYDGVDLFIWGNAESNVTIVAASIPVLRVLLRDVSTNTRRYYISNPQVTNHTARSDILKSTTVVVSRNRRATSSPGKPQNPDDSSDKSMLSGCHLNRGLDTLDWPLASPHLATEHIEDSHYFPGRSLDLACVRDGGHPAEGRETSERRDRTSVQDQDQQPRQQQGHDMSANSVRDYHGFYDQNSEEIEMGRI